MARRTTIKPLQSMSEINMTPLIDLTFLLLITFMITMPLIEQGIPINLPRGETREINQSDSRSVSVDVDGNVYLDSVAVSMEDLAEQLKLIAASSPETPVLVRADEKLHYGKVMQILRIMNDAKISRMALVTTPDA